MRILSLGCHDGFIEMWLQQQLDVEVCGVELHPHAVDEARRRGIDCKQGLAEDAPRLFELGSFDAVVAYELVEHVPDVDALLHVCEEMVKPGGQILLSTPEGTFGEGGNPHHLRALRSVDLADMLRRRGKLNGFTVGPDRISVASYTPGPKEGEIAIFTGPTVAWHPMDIETKGLGGSETAAFRVAESLSRQGYVVTLYGEFEQSGAMCDLILRDWRTFDPTTPRQAVISSRMPELFDRPINAERTLLWCHDTDYGDRLTPEREERIGCIVALSNWHVQYLRETYKSYPCGSPIACVRNGITPGYYRPQDGLVREKRVVYSSSPDRGLDILLDLWPLVLEQVPDAQLTCCYPDYFDRAAESDKRLASFRDQLRDKITSLNGVNNAGSLSLPNLAQLMRSSLVWAHPSYNTPNGQRFHETSCIGALEAQACGCRVVAADWGALPETVSTGALVDGDPTTLEWQERFAAQLVEGLMNPDVQALAQTAGPEEAASCTWDAAAERIAQLCDPG